jgi:hypothetical protein
MKYLTFAAKRIVFHSPKEAMNGTPKTLYTAIMNGMHSLTPVAHEMMKLPLDEDPAHTGCPTFEWLA